MTEHVGGPSGRIDPHGPIVGQQRALRALGYTEDAIRGLVRVAPVPRWAKQPIAPAFEDALEAREGQEEA